MWQIQEAGDPWAAGMRVAHQLADPAASGQPASAAAEYEAKHDKTTAITRRIFAKSADRAGNAAESEQCGDERDDSEDWRPNET